MQDGSQDTSKSTVVLRNEENNDSIYILFDGKYGFPVKGWRGQGLKGWRDEGVKGWRGEGVKNELGWISNMQ